MKIKILAVLAMAIVPLAAQPGPRGGNRVDFLSGYLNLTDAQKTQATAIFDAAKTAATTQQGKVAAAHDALEAAVKAGTSDSQIDTLAATLGSAQGAMEAIRAKAEVKFRAILTAEQKTKLDAGPGPGRGPRGMGAASGMGRGPRN